MESGRQRITICQPDALTALTLVPAWSWPLVGVLPVALRRLRRPRWVRAIVLGAWAVVGYAFVTETPGRHNPVLLALAGLVILTVPGLLLLPLDAMMRDSRGPTLFYAWSVLTTAIVRPTSCSGEYASAIPATMVRCSVPTSS